MEIPAGNQLQAYQLRIILPDVQVGTFFFCSIGAERPGVVREPYLIPGAGNPFNPGRFAQPIAHSYIGRFFLQVQPHDIDFCIAIVIITLKGGIAGKCHACNDRDKGYGDLQSQQTTRKKIAAAELYRTSENIGGIKSADIECRVGAGQQGYAQKQGDQEYKQSMITPIMSGKLYITEHGIKSRQPVEIDEDRKADSQQYDQGAFQ